MNVKTKFAGGQRFSYILFSGDSTTRAVYCSLLRILGGTETLGPLNSDLCVVENWWKHLRYYSWYFLSNYNWCCLCWWNLLIVFSLRYTKNIEYSKLQLTFRFEMSFDTNVNNVMKRTKDVQHMDWQLETAMRSMNTYAIMTNTGIIIFFFWFTTFYLFYRRYCF